MNSSAGWLQGIASDVKRTQANEADVDVGRIQHDDPDLMAYWTFEEGSGYLVKDVTGKGHDLHIQQPPQWRVSSCTTCTTCTTTSLLLSAEIVLSLGSA